jgi:hypothetical protein
MRPIEDPARRASRAAAPPSATPIGSPTWSPRSIPEHVRVTLRGIRRTVGAARPAKPFSGTYHGIIESFCGDGCRCGGAFLRLPPASESASDEGGYLGTPGGAPGRAPCGMAPAAGFEMRSRHRCRWKALSFAMSSNRPIWPWTGQLSISSDSNSDLPAFPTSNRSHRRHVSSIDFVSSLISTRLLTRRQSARRPMVPAGAVFPVPARTCLPPTYRRVLTCDGRQIS